MKTKTQRNKTKRGPKKDRDELGCIIGSLSNRVNVALKKNKSADGWMTDEEIAKAGNMTVAQARHRLYYATVQGQFESRRLFQYRLKK